MIKEEKLISECLRLAGKGRGEVSPNPLVGCIITKGGKIIGKGYHKKFGENHAEINAISDALKRGYNLKDASLYVNLEPCSHFGKTPPCVDEIIKNKIKSVYFGMNDPNPLIKNKGIKILLANGINVKSNILEKKCQDFNKFFVKFITKQLPFITLKVAQSLDGKIALDNGQSKWITTEKSRRFVHRLRSRYDAILIGKNTAMLDNPHLTSHLLNRSTPKRFVIDKNLSLSSNLNIFQNGFRNNTFIITSDKNKKYKNKFDNIIFLKENNGKINLKDILKYFYKINISSVLVEGGAYLFSGFLEQNLFDDIYFVIASKVIGNGLSPFCNFRINNLSKSRHLVLESIKKSDKDIILHYNNLNKINTCSQE